MAKRSQKRPVRYDKDHSGCMWGLINIFDFRHGRSTQRLLSDRRRSGRLSVGAGSPMNKLHTLTWNDNREGTFDGEETRTVAADAGKPSVKSLIEEEMIGEQDAKEINNAEVEPKVFDSEQGNRKKKSRKRMKKAQKKSRDNIHDLDALESVKSEESFHHISEHQSTISLDIDNVMEEFCHQIYQKSVTCVNHDQPDELHLQSNQKNPDFEEKLTEAIKLLIGQKLIKGKHLSEDGEIHPSNELQDALQILGSDGELFLKHLKDPNSVLVKCIQNFLDAQLEKDEDTKSVAGSNISEQEVSNLGQSDELVNHKQRRFFRKKVKSQERSPLTGNKASQTSNRIVILKPGPTSVQSLETERSIGSSPEPHYSIRNKGLNERIGSHFFLSEIKRKLKNAMGKEHQRISTDGIPKGLAYERQNSGNRDRGVKENVGINSPSKDHFFIEKIARPVGVKKGDKIGKLKDCDLDTKEKSANLPKQRVSNIYIEAKKHLSEMLNNGDENMDSSSRRVPKTLGRILSVPEYNFSPVGSPGRNWEPSFVTAQMRFLDSDTLQEMNESTSSLEQDSRFSHLGETTKSLETQPCISGEITDDKVEAASLDSNSSVNQFHDNEVGKTSFSIGDEVLSIDDVEIVKTNGAVVQEESSVLDAPCEPSSSSSIKDDDQNVDESEIGDGQSYCSDIKQELSVDNQLPSSPLASPSKSSATKKVEDQGSAIDILERPSPVSVLEPLFAEEDISPASTRSRSAEVPVQPLQIQFEECDSATEDQCIQMKSSMEDKKSIFEYVKTVLQTSGLNWDELFMKSLSSDQLLDPSLCEEIEFFPSQLCYEQKLLFDCINEVLMEVCGHYFGCTPSVSFAKPYIRPVPNMQNALHEIWEGILWHLIPLPLPHTLDQTVRKDLAKSGSWMDLRFDTDCVGIEMGEVILEELMEDTILSLENESLESRCPVILAVS
ncbi:hypothetical protein Patl1_00454 [Pistacia atlantica]|uniref:Uncharacterized protein n=1 Tax=Pistacia atlantica TaxID=434234 RepID=A0ACC1CCV6_9ROSI|nr:hypothetical protein Patl1_00454 [Pistacia atlantica]